MVWVIAFGELFFGDLWCVVWGYGGMRTHFSLLNPGVRLGLKQRQVIGAVCWLARHLWPGFGDLSLYLSHLSVDSPDLSMFFRHLCARCGPVPLTYRCAIHLWPRCSASIGE